MPQKSTDLEIALNRLKSHVTNSPLAVVEFDPEYRIVQWSKRAEDMYGWTANEVLGRKISDFRWVYEDDIGKVAALSRDMFEGRQATNINENRNYRKDGSVITCEWYNSALFDSDGQLLSVLSLILDITERKRVEEALDRTNRQLEFVLVNSMDAAYQRNLQTDRYDYMSPVIESLTGFSAEEFSHLPLEKVMERVHPDDLPHLQKEIEYTSLGTKETGSIEYRYRNKSGEYRWLSDSFNLIRDEEGRPLYRVGIVRDVTGGKADEELLRKERDRFSALINSIQEEVWFIDCQGNITLVNQAVLRRLGSRQVVGKSLISILEKLEFYRADGSVLPVDEAPPLRALNGEMLTHQEEIFQDPDQGGARYRDVSAAPVRGADGEIVGSVTVVHDITDRKKVERQLATNSVLLDTLLKQAPVGIAYLDRKLRFVMINEKLAQFNGLSVELHIGKRIHEIMPASWPEVQKVTRQILKTGQAVENHEFSMPGTSDPDVRRYLNESWYPMRDEKGSIAGFGCIVEEITQRKQVEEALRRAHDELELRVKERTGQLRRSEEISRKQLMEIETYYDIAPIGLATLDPQMRYVRINKRLADMNGLPVSEHIGRTVREVVPAEAEEIEKVVRQVIATGKPVTNVDIVKESIVHPGARRIYRSQWFPIMDITDRVASIGVMLEDITEHRRLEEQLRQSQKMQAIGTLAGGIAHDFNNILAGIIGFSEIVEEDLPDNSQLKQYMKRVLQASFRGRDLVKQILAFSRKIEHVREPVSLGEIVEETTRLLRASIPATIEIVTKIKTAHDRVRASAVELQQILMNLATNAARAMSEKGGTLTISVSDVDREAHPSAIDPEVEPGEHIQLTVHDTGIGMKPEVMKRIFEPFFTTGTVGEGTGMGLAAVYGIVKSLNGTIVVESKPRSGSVFRVFLPKIHVQARSEKGRIPDTAPIGKERVLFIDDEELLVELGRSTLKKLGYEVTALMESTEALNVFSADPYGFDIVITDQAMPKISGLKLARKFLRIRPDIPIILCTGHSDSVTPELIKRVGISLFVMKPLARNELALAIRKVLEK
ncbi:MAG: signal transduction histidine kinase, nitrogen specific, NtrB [Deltaproteobacteria bacterium]|nr:signal transduction histidine kinase, nitrogen specific, NtrB [Deltaproteobacteria bacterium]